MPKQRILYWDGLKSQLDNIPNELKNTLKQILLGEYAAAWLKKIGDNLYSSRINNTHRLLFTTQDRQLILLEVVLNHDYQKAKFLNPQVLKSYRRKLEAVGELHEIEEVNLAQEDADSLRPSDAMVVENEHEFEYVPIVPTSRGMVTLSVEQQQILNTSMLTLPAVIRGDAGSGKTTILTAVLAKWVRTCKEASESAAQAGAKILYLVDSKDLLKETRAFFLTNIYPGAEELVDFMTYEQLIKRQLPHVEIVNALKPFLLSEISKRECPDFLRAQPIGYWLEECRLISGCEDELTYQKMGRKMSLLVWQDKSAELIESEKKVLWDLFQRYLLSLTPRQVDLTYSSLSRESIPRYKQIIVDETHILSAAQLRYLSCLVLNQEIIWSMDMNQRMHDRRFNHFAYLQQLGMSELSVYEMSLSFRNPIEVQMFASELQTMKYMVNPNSPDKRTAAAAAAAYAQNSEHVVQVMETLDDAFVTDLVKSLDVMIVTQEAHVLALQQKYQTGLVGTAEQVIGLEFDSVFVLDALSHEELRALEQKLSSETTKHARKQDQAHDALELALNRVFVACTRVTKEGRLYFYQTGLTRCPTILGRFEAFIASTPNVANSVIPASEEKTQVVVRKLEAKGLHQQAKLVAELAAIQSMGIERQYSGFPIIASIVAAEKRLPKQDVNLVAELIDEQKKIQSLPLAKVAQSSKSNEDKPTWQIVLLSNFNEENLQKTFDWLANNFSKKKQEQLFNVKINGYSSLISAIILVKERLSIFIPFLKKSLISQKEYFKIFVEGCHRVIEDEEPEIDKALERAYHKLGPDAPMRQFIQEGGLYGPLLDLLKAFEQQDKQFFDLFVYELIKIERGIELISALSHLPGYEHKFARYFITKTPFPGIDNDESRMGRLFRHELGIRVFWRLFDLTDNKTRRDFLSELFLKNKNGRYPFGALLEYHHEEKIAQLIRNKVLRIPNGVLGTSVSQINMSKGCFQVENYNLLNLFFLERLAERILIFNALLEVDANFFNNEVSKAMLCNRYKVYDKSGSQGIYSTALNDLAFSDDGLRFLLERTTKDNHQFVSKIEPSVLFREDGTKSIIYHLFSSRNHMALLEAWMQFPSFAKPFLLHIKNHISFKEKAIPEESWVGYLFSTRTGHQLLNKMAQEDPTWITNLSLNMVVPLPRGLQNCVLGELATGEERSCIYGECKLLPSGSILLKVGHLLNYTTIGRDILKLVSPVLAQTDSSAAALASPAKTVSTGLLAEIGFYSEGACVVSSADYSSAQPETA